MTAFTDLPLQPEILSALKRMGFEKASPIQAATLPHVLEGRDVIGLAETGSGKTAACAIPICQRVDPSRKEIQALVVVPTRELALQYATETQKIGELKGVKSFALLGGEEMDVQRAKLKSGVQVLIATPGRLIDFVYSRLIELDQVETLILDEADEMLSMGFVDDLEFIIQCLVHEHQTLLFSATMPPAIRKIAVKHMKEPQEVGLIQERKIPKTIEHLFAFVKRGVRREELLLQLLEQTKPRQSLIFCRSRAEVETLHRYLRGKMSGVDFLHGGLSQPVRTAITGKFRSGKVRHMVATDVAARGLDFSGVTHVFNFGLPNDVDSYVHRTGRTGRSGREGTALTLVMGRDMGALERICKRIERKPKWIGEPPTRG
jgi:ATP-dependent RNA helicase DeaD